MAPGCVKSEPRVKRGVTDNLVKFKINGRNYSVGENIPPGTTLDYFIRDYAKLSGTKFMCQEGGCGACVVSVRSKDVATQQERTYAVNSCLVRVHACHGWAIKTIEGLGNKKVGYHPLQARLAHLNGSQCGYCTSGMIMNMASLLENKELTMKEIENSFGGNICRCTGYRPILDTFKSFAVDAPQELKNEVQDIEELYKMKTCPKSGKSCFGKCSDIWHDDDDNDVDDKNIDDEENEENGIDDDFVHVNSDGTENNIIPIDLSLQGARWVRVTKLSDIFDLFEKSNNVPYVLVGGNTASGVYRPTIQPLLYIDVQDVPELTSYSVGPVLKIGANMSLNSVIRLFNTVSKKNNNYAYTEHLARHIDLIASTPVRNIGTVAGNLCTKHTYNEFPSDMFLILETVGATLTIVSAHGQKHVPLMEFLDMDMHHKILKHITLPPLDDSYCLKTYKIRCRAQNAHAYVNAGFLFRLKNVKKGKILGIPRIVYGGITPNTVHANETERFMKDKFLFDARTMRTGLKILEKELQPDYVLPDASPVFRKRLALALFYKFVLSLSPPGVPSRILSGGKDLLRPLSSGRQDFETKKSLWPLTKPEPKLEALAQCSGEAKYVNDMPSLPEEVFAEFVLTTVGQGYISNIDPSEALNIPGVLKFFTAQDCPGKNSFTPLEFPVFNEEIEEVFCSGDVKYAGQPLGLIVAKTRQLALLAATKVKVKYTNVVKPQLNMRKVIASGDKTRVRVEREPSSVNEHNQNDVKHVIKGKFDVGSQYHFTMETQQCICIPIEDGLDVFACTQWMDGVQVGIAQALNIPESSINIYVRRLGGAYGCKITRSVWVAVACALAAHKLNRPVRLIMPLESNMEVMGKRKGACVDYEVGVNNDGKIIYLKGDFYLSAGWSWNEKMVSTTLDFISNCYDASSWKWRGLAVRCDFPSTTWTRAPCSTEGIGTIEHIMEQIAKVVKKDPIDVRIINLNSDDNIPLQYINDIRSSSEFDLRKQSIDDFNEKHRWRKRGIALVPMKYGMVYFGNFYSLVSIYAQDGTVAIAHGGIEIGQGINTKVAQAAAYTLGIDLKLVKIKPSNTLTAPNNMVTGGSLATDLCTYATVECCKKLLKRMEPAKKGLKNPTWQQWVQAAYQQNIDLMATHMYPYKGAPQTYNIYGATVCEVELDVLTGEHVIRRVDILEDAGRSMNPDIDIGQVEGAFVMGLGYWLTEYLVYDPNSGKLLTNRTWTYKPLGAKDIPIDFRVELRKNAPNPFGVLRAKATGEPPMVMSVSVVFALRYALDSARKEAGKYDFFHFGLPATVENKFLAGLADVEHFEFK